MLHTYFWQGFFNTFCSSVMENIFNILQTDYELVIIIAKLLHLLESLFPHL